MTERHTKGHNTVVRLTTMQYPINGHPEATYTYRAGDELREDNVQAFLKAAKAEALKRHMEWAHQLTAVEWLNHRPGCATCTRIMPSVFDSPAMQEHRRKVAGSDELPVV